MAKILIVEDDLEICSQLVTWLSFENHTVEAVHDGQEGSDRLKFYQYEAIILDLDLPKVTGFDVCKRFRESGGMTPILMLTGKSDIADKEEGLDSGADDYLTKPFHMKELSARIRALLRRSTSVVGNILELRGYSIDTAKKQFSVNSEVVDLSPKEFSLMEFFMRHPDEVFSKEALLERVWSSESEASVFSVYTAVKTLRQKLSVDGKKSFLSTVHGMGYRLESK
jgi:DNA-binding response OmpR family regulator